MEDLNFFLTAVAEQYGTYPLALHPLRRKNPEGKRLYRVDFAEGPSWVMRAYQQSYAKDIIFGWLSRYSSLLEWLQTRAEILSYLYRRGYPIPMVIPTRTETLIGFQQEWLLLMTAFIDGDARETSPEKMLALGASLGLLHTQPLPDKYRQGSSWWPFACFEDGLQRLTASAQYVPAEWQEFYENCIQTFRYFLQRPHLSQTLIHGDCWAENGIQIGKEQAILIDWECAGLGIAILDFGSLLLHCHFDQLDAFEDHPDPPFRPDLERISAVVQGYNLWRHLPPEELNVLLEAVRFSIAWRGAWFFSLLAKMGPNKNLQRAMICWRRWYAISEEIAALAHQVIN